MKKKSESSYNERLFTQGIRGKLHTARFEWLAKSLIRLNCEYQSVLELGCYDGKVIDYLPERPARYLGLDANWEGGLDIAFEKWAKQSNYVFRQCKNPDEMKIGEKQFDISICMETLEHIPPQLVAPYLEQLARATKEYIFVTVPNEIGIVFTFKQGFKLLFGDYHSYTVSEFINQTLGNTDKVERDNHKGFSYKKLVAEISGYFDIIEVSGHPLKFAPAGLNFGIGIIGKSKEPKTNSELA